MAIDRATLIRNWPELSFLTVVVGSESANIAGGNAAPSRNGGMARSLFIGTAGNVNVQYADGTTDIIPGLAVGIWHPMAVTLVIQANTTASNIKFGY